MATSNFVRIDKRYNKENMGINGFGSSFTTKSSSGRPNYFSKFSFIKGKEIANRGESESHKTKDLAVPGRILSQSSALYHAQSKSPRKNDKSQKNVLINDLQEIINRKDKEISNLKNVNTKLEISLDNCKRELRIQINEAEALKARLSESRLCRSCFDSIKSFVIIMKIIDKKRYVERTQVNSVKRSKRN